MLQNAGKYPWFLFTFGCTHQQHILVQFEVSFAVQFGSFHAGFFMHLLKKTNICSASLSISRPTGSSSAWIWSCSGSFLLDFIVYDGPALLAQLAQSGTAGGGLLFVEESKWINELIVPRGRFFLLFSCTAFASRLTIRMERFQVALKLQIYLCDCQFVSLRAKFNSQSFSYQRLWRRRSEHWFITLEAHVALELYKS